MFLVTGQAQKEAPEVNAIMAMGHEETAGAEVGFAHEDGDLAHIPLDLVDFREGFNPRRYHAPQAHTDLVESIRAEGVIQPVVLRPVAGRYEVIAGERRVRAARAAGLHEIPAYIRIVSDAAAHAMAAVENITRENMSAVEEAHAARTQLANAGGDKAEVCRTLGWSRTRLESRLLLLNASAAVQQALIEGRIKTGHAELLCGLPEPMQDGTLGALIEKGISVAELKARISGIARDLAAASFDTTACAGCPHNSSLQASLFDTHVGSGRCTNHACWCDKETAFLNARIEVLRESFPAVRTDKDTTDGGHRILLVREIGDAQMSACKGCANFGAILSTKPGEAGTLIEDVCFDPPCHQKKCAAFAEESRAVSAPVQTAGKAAAGTASAGSSARAAPEKAKEAKTLPAKVVENAKAVRQRTARTLLEGNPRMQRIVAAAALLSELGHSAEENRGVLEPYVRVRLHTAADRIKRLLEETDEGLNRIIGAATRALLDPEVSKPEYTDGRTTSLLLSMCEVDWPQHFQLNREFLEPMTKAGIESILAEAGFVTWLEDRDGKGAFRKLAGQTKAEFIDAVLQAGFDFSKFTPAMITQAQ